jgi:hypothetical protein
MLVVGVVTSVNWVPLRVVENWGHVSRVKMSGVRGEVKMIGGIWLVARVR